MEKKTTKKVIKLSAQTLGQLENSEAAAIGRYPGTQLSRPGCCP